MKVLFSVRRYHPNHDGMVSGLLAAGHSVAFLVRGTAADEQHREGVSVTMLPSGRTPYRLLLAFLRAKRPDVVVARNAGTVNYAVFLACRLLGIPYLLYVQKRDGYEPMRPGWRLRLALGLWPRHTINSVCSAPARALPGKTFDFLPFAMELGAPKPAYPTELPIRVITVGRLDGERKNLVPLVRHLAPLAREGKLELTIVGLRRPEVSPAFGALLAEIEGQDVARQVRILENLDHARTLQLYPEHDLFVLASSREMAAISPVEAMASGLAAICGSDNGTNYFVRPGETGFIFPDKDFATLAAHVDRLVADLPKLERMGRNARQLIAEHYAPADYARRFEEIVYRHFGARPA